MNRPRVTAIGEAPKRLLTVEEIAAIPDLENRAMAIIDNQIFNDGEANKQLILSVSGAWIPGAFAQSNLVPREPPKVKPKITRRKRQEHPKLPSLFETFGIDTE